MHLVLTSDYGGGESKHLTMPEINILRVLVHKFHSSNDLFWILKWGVVICFGYQNGVRSVVQSKQLTAATKRRR